MFIKFDDLDMLDFFMSDPVFIGEEEAGNLIYSIKDDNMFSMVLTIDTYGQKIDITISYCDNIIFVGQFDNIIEITKSDNILLVEVEGSKKLVMKKSPFLGVFIENG